MSSNPAKLYLIDASVLITAHNKYYPIDRVPEFWDWLKHVGLKSRAKIPLENFEEIKEGPKGERDQLFAWFEDEENRTALVLEEEVDVELVRQVVAKGYAPDLTDEQVEQVGRDPFLVAYALADRENRCVVSLEVSAPGKTRQNRRLPDVCRTVGVAHCDPFQMNLALGFRTGWSKSS